MVEAAERAVARDAVDVPADVPAEEVDVDAAGAGKKAGTATLNKPTPHPGPHTAETLKSELSSTLICQALTMTMTRRAEMMMRRTGSAGSPGPCCPPSNY